MLQGGRSCSSQQNLPRLEMHTAVAFPLIDNQVFIFNMYLGHREDILTDKNAGPDGPHVLVQLIQLIQFFPF